MKMIFFIISLIPILIQYDLEAQLNLHLTVNFSQSDTIIAGDPVMLRVSVSNPTSEYASIHNNAVEENLEQLEEEYRAGKIDDETYQKERSRLDSARQLTSQVVLNTTGFIEDLQIYRNNSLVEKRSIITCNPTLSDHQEIILEGSTRAIFKLAITPDYTAKWSPETYKFHAAFDSIHSNNVMLSVQSAMEAHESDSTRRVALANYHLDCGQPDQALLLANELMETYPGLDVVILKADALVAVDRGREALDFYRQALEMFYAEFPDSYEAPEYLLDMISALEEQE